MLMALMARVVAIAVEILMARRPPPPPFATVVAAGAAAAVAAGAAVFAAPVECVRWTSGLSARRCPTAAQHFLSELNS
eukprot:11173639-Lingulodinium_polyedra.AAC.1